MDTSPSHREHMLPNGLGETDRERIRDPLPELLAASITHADTEYVGAETESFLCSISSSASPRESGSGTDSPLEYPPNPPPANDQPTPTPLTQSPVIGCHFDQLSYLDKQSSDQINDASYKKCRELGVPPCSNFYQESDIYPTFNGQSFRWNPSRDQNKGSEDWFCHVCDTSFEETVNLREHFYRLHVNPHFSSIVDQKAYNLTNFLVKPNNEETKTEYPCLYRCHECFVIFPFHSSLRGHLKDEHSLSSNSSDSDLGNKMVVAAAMAPKIDKLSLEDFNAILGKSKKVHKKK